jgi:hypothetical protein
MTAEAAPPTQLTSEDIDYAAMALDTAQLAELVGERGECVFSWTSLEGYPVGVMVAYVYRDGTFWTSCAGRKKRLRALCARPQSAVVISKDGHTATFKGDSVIHSRGDNGWDELTRWFYPALAGVDPRSGDPRVRGLLRYLDAPHLAIIETPASLVVSFDFGKFNNAVQAAITAGLQQGPHFP